MKKKRKLDKCREEKGDDEGWFSIPQYNTLLSGCIPNMTILSYVVQKKSLTKKFIIQNWERKRIGQIQGSVSWRRLVLSPKIQEVVINLYAKYDNSRLPGCEEIFDEIFD